VMEECVLYKEERERGAPPHVRECVVFYCVLYVCIFVLCGIVGFVESSGSLSLIVEVGEFGIDRS